MISLPAGRKPAASVQEIACGHASYFFTAVGLQAIAAGLTPT
jgi:hypothetical protein